MPSGEQTRWVRAVPGGRWRKLGTIAFIAAMGLGAVAGDTLFVGRRVLPIRSGKFAFDKVLGNANQGDVVKVIGVEGKYLKVSYAPTGQPPVEGYVLESALSVLRPEVATTQNSGNAAAVGGTMAGKGVLDSQKFADDGHLSQAPLQAMEQQSARAMSESDAAFEEFMKAGKIGLFKPLPSDKP